MSQINWVSRWKSGQICYKLSPVPQRFHESRYASGTCHVASIKAWVEGYDKVKILVVAPEYGNSPYAASLRYEALCRELIQNPSITVEVVSGCGEGSNTLSIWQRCFNINARKGSTLVRLGKELIFGVRVSVLVAVRRRTSSCFQYLISFRFC